MSEYLTMLVHGDVYTLLGRGDEASARAEACEMSRSGVEVAVLVDSEPAEEIARYHNGEELRPISNDRESVRARFERPGEA